MVARMLPFRWMGDCSGPHHVVVNVEEALAQMGTALDKRRMIPSAPESSFSSRAPVIALSHAPLEILHAFLDLRPFSGIY